MSRPCLLVSYFKCCITWFEKFCWWVSSYKNSSRECFFSWGKAIYCFGIALSSYYLPYSMCSCRIIQQSLKSFCEKAYQANSICFFRQILCLIYYSREFRTEMLYICHYNSEGQKELGMIKIMIKISSWKFEVRSQHFCYFRFYIGRCSWFFSKLVIWQIGAFDYNINTVLCCFFFKKHYRGCPSSCSNQSGKPQIVVMAAKAVWIVVIAAKAMWSAQDYFS